MLVKVFGAAMQGIDALTVTIEVNCSQGIHFYMVGLADTAVRESHERIRSALQHNGYKFPHRQLIINLAPADLRKEGSAYDLPLAIGILAAAEEISADKLSRYMIMGELSLDGSILPIRGALPIAIQARAQGFDGLIVPKAKCARSCCRRQAPRVRSGKYLRGSRFFQRRAGTDTNDHRHTCRIFCGSK